MITDVFRQIHWTLQPGYWLWVDGIFSGGFRSAWDRESAYEVAWLSRRTGHFDFKPLFTYAFKGVTKTFDTQEARLKSFRRVKRGWNPPLPGWEKGSGQSAGYIKEMGLITVEEARSQIRARCPKGYVYPKVEDFGFPLVPQARVNLLLESLT